MHLIERYALSTGLEIDNPFISELFFPTSCKEYVCFHASSKDNLRDYDYWNEVKNMLNPTFQKLNLKTIQIGLQKDPDLKCDIDLRGQTDMRQMSYIVKNCELFVGVDSFPAHIAGHFNRKIVSIYSNSFAACVRPYWGDRSNQKIIETERPNGEKPSFSFNENPKTINRIKPEKIANNALTLLGQDPVSIKTLSMGLMCKQPSVEVIPSVTTSVISENIIVRMDKSHNEKVLSEILQRNTVEVITCKPISEPLLSCGKIKKITYKSGNIKNDFISKMKNNGIEFAVICTNPERTSEFRSKNFDTLIHDCPDKHIIEQNKKRFKGDLQTVVIDSAKKIVCGSNTYNSHYEYGGRKNKSDFFLEFDWLFIYTK